MCKSLPRIFVQIASYRDPECLPTLRDMFAKAANPGSITAGICWQGLPEDAALSPTTLTDARVQTIDVNAKESHGACWARHRAQSLWRGEEWCLQIDSHMRFVQDWDTVLLSQYDQCPSRKAVLSAYPVRYDPPDTLGDPAVVQAMAAEFQPSGLLRVSSRAISLEHAPHAPQPTAFISGAFIFGPAAHMIECPYDPHLYFWGEEQTVAARLWTHGWDIFMPCVPTLYHHYGKRTHHWDDNPHWSERDRVAIKRACHMLGSAVTDDRTALVDLDRYGLGTARTLQDFYAFSGVDYARKTIGGQAHDTRKAAGLVPA